MDNSAIASESNRVRATTGSESTFQQIPWLAYTSLLVVLLCIGASVSVIIDSNNRIVESWRISPSVLLGTLASLSNIALDTAFSAGVAVIWWISATEGASLWELNYIWDRGEGISFFYAINAGVRARRVVIAASFIVAVKVAINPLLQRATHQSLREIVTHETIQMNVVQQLPEGWTGYVSNGRGAATNQAIAIVQDWWHNTTIHSLDAPGYSCNGTCEGNVRGAGISYNCSSTTQSLNLITGIGSVVFAINTTMLQNSTGAPFLRLTTLHSSSIDDTCTATLTIDNCDIQAAIVNYPVIIQNSTITLNPNKLNNSTSAISTYIYPGDSPTLTDAQVGTLRGLQFSFGFYLFTNSSVRTPVDYFNSVANMNADMFYQTEPSSYNNFTYTTCPLQWFSPTSFVLNSMQNFMFRAALRASNHTDVQSFRVRRTKPALVFHSDYKYLVAASLITLLGLFLLLFMLQGWWTLGRKISLNPIETAKAFGAQLLAGVGYNNVRADQILEAIGSTRVKYDGRMIVRDKDEGVEL